MKKEKGLRKRRKKEKEGRRRMKNINGGGKLKDNINLNIRFLVKKANLQRVFPGGGGGQQVFPPSRAPFS